MTGNDLKPVEKQITSYPRRNKLLGNCTIANTRTQLNCIFSSKLQFNRSHDELTTISNDLLVSYDKLIEH